MTSWHCFPNKTVPVIIRQLSQLSFGIFHVFRNDVGAKVVSLSNIQNGLLMKIKQ